MERWSGCRWRGCTQSFIVSPYIPFLPLPFVWAAGDPSWVLEPPSRAVYELFTSYQTILYAVLLSKEIYYFHTLPLYAKNCLSYPKYAIWIYFRESTHDTSVTLEMPEWHPEADTRTIPSIIG